MSTILPPTELLLFGLLDIFPVIANSLHPPAKSTKGNKLVWLFFFLTQLVQQD